MSSYTDKLITDFSDPVFQKAFKQYFSELEVEVDDWDELFKQMNDEGVNQAYVRLDENNEVVGFIQFQPMVFKSWFFEETYGFVREFWVGSKHRGKRHGTELLGLAEKYMSQQGIYSIILTTDTAPDFYLKLGYVRAPGCKALNNDDVFIKRL